VTSKSCKKGECPRREYDPKLSTSYKSLDATTVQKFGSGRLWSAGAQDFVKIGPYDKQMQKFREITKMDGSMTDLWETVSFDGILGLSYTPRVPGGNHSTTINETTILEHLDIGSFTACFGRRTYHLDSNSWTETPSRLYWERPKVLGSPKYTYLDVIGEHHWAVKMSRVSVKSQDYNESWKATCWDKPCAAIIDTGMGIMSAPDRQLMELVRLLPPVYKDCTNKHLLPEIQFRLGGDGEDGIDVSLPPSAYVDHLILPPLPSEYAPPGMDKVRETCTSMWAAQNLGSPQGPVFILGVPFLQQFLVEYDRAKKRVAIAKHQGDCPGAADENGAANMADTAGFVNTAGSTAGSTGDAIHKLADARSLLGGIQNSGPATNWL